MEVLSCDSFCTHGYGGGRSFQGLRQIMEAKYTILEQDKIKKNVLRPYERLFTFDVSLNCRLHISHYEI